MDDLINVEVVYVIFEKQLFIEFMVLVGFMVEQVIMVLGVFDIYFEIEFKKVKVGVWNWVVKFLLEVNNGDCIEVYCLLIVDLKEVCKCWVEKVIQEGWVDKVIGGCFNLLKVGVKN